MFTCYLNVNFNVSLWLCYKCFSEIDARIIISLIPENIQANQIYENFVKFFVSNNEKYQKSYFHMFRTFLLSSNILIASNGSSISKWSFSVSDSLSTPPFWMKFITFILFFNSIQFYSNFFRAFRLFVFDLSISTLEIFCGFYFSKINIITRHVDYVGTKIVIINNIRNILHCSP